MVPRLAGIRPVRVRGFLVVAALLLFRNGRAALSPLSPNLVTAPIVAPTQKPTPKNLTRHQAAPGAMLSAGPLQCPQPAPQGGRRDSAPALRRHGGAALHLRATYLLCELVIRYPIRYPVTVIY